MRKHILGFVMLGALLPCAATAQRAAAWHDSAQRLDAAMHSLRDSLLQGDSSAAEVARRGDLAIASTPNERSHAVDVLTEFAKGRSRRFAGAMPSAGGFRIVIRTARWMNRSKPTTADQGSMVLVGLPDTGTAVHVQTSAGSSAVDAALLDRFGEMMIAGVPEVQRWIESPPPLSLDEAQRRDQAMYAFVTANGAIQRRCVAGGLVACRVALNIRQIDGPENGGRYSPFMRADLLYFALDLGGTGSWERLRSSSDTTLEGRLAAAAGVPMDSLLTQWRRGLLALRPATSVLPIRSGLIAIGWTLALLLGALGASKWA